MESSIYSHSNNRGVLVCIVGSNPNIWQHFPSHREAIVALEGIVEELHRTSPIEDLPENYGSNLADMLAQEFSLLVEGKETVVRLKFLRETKNYNVYVECDYNDEIVVGSNRKIGDRTYLRKGFLSGEPPPYLTARFRLSAPIDNADSEEINHD